MNINLVDKTKGKKMPSMYIFINWQMRCSVRCTELVTKWIHERKTLYEILFWNTIFKKETITSSLIWKPYISHVRQIEIVLVWNQRRDVRRGGGILQMSIQQNWIFFNQSHWRRSKTSRSYLDRLHVETRPYHQHSSNMSSCENKFHSISEHVRIVLCSRVQVVWIKLIILRW